MAGVLLLSRTEGVAYADSTALIALARLGRLDLMRAVANEIRVTTAVWGLALRESIADCVGVVGVLLRATRLQMVPSIRPLIEQLLADDFRLSNSLVRAVLDAAGE